MTTTSYRIRDVERTKALALLDEIANKAAGLDHEYEPAGHVIAALAESVAGILRSADQAAEEGPF